MKIIELLLAKENRDIKRIDPRLTLRETANELIRLQVGALIVTDDSNKMIGIVSERDLIQVVASHDTRAADAPVSEIMTRSIITCKPEDEVAFALHQMNKYAIRHMPVLECDELIGVLSIRELTKAYELLRIEASTDPLTQVSNRRQFLKTLSEEVDRALRYEHPISVAMLDIDHFKQVNDTYGHDAGDSALRVLSGLIISEFRTIDLVGRLGGEEFALVFPETEMAGARIACERLRVNIQSAQIPVDQSNIAITVSMGIASMTKDVTDSQVLLKRADEMLYTAKRNGRNKVVIDRENFASDLSSPLCLGH